MSGRVGVSGLASGAVGLAALTLFFSGSVQGADEAAESIQWFHVGMQLLGGLALFLGGLEVLSDGLRKAAGHQLRVVMSKLTSNRLSAALTGAFVTGVLNSSSVTTVLVVGFVTAGVMSLSQSVGVIMGANIGSTVTAQILAFNVSAYALLPVALGFFLYFAGRGERLRQAGLMILGLGLVFYGMGLMSDAMTPLRSYEPFMTLLGKMANPLFGIVAGALFTALVQSSAATVGIAIAMASEGLLSLPAGIALAMGANIGTCVTALLAALGKPVEAVRAAVVHVGFNIIGVIVWLPFLPVLADLAVSLSPIADDLTGAAKLAEEVPRQIANANTMFNVINTLLFLPFTALFAAAAVRFVPDRRSVEEKAMEAAYLDPAALKVPSVALENVRREIHRAGQMALEMMQDLGQALGDRQLAPLDDLKRRNAIVDGLDPQILEYLAHLRQIGLSDEESHEHQQLMTAMVNVTGLANVLEGDMGPSTRRFLESGAPRASDTTREMLGELWSTVYTALELAIQAVASADEATARGVLALKDDVRERSERVVARHAQRLRPDESAYLDKVRFILSTVEQLRHLYTLAKRIAKAHLREPDAR